MKSTNVVSLSKHVRNINLNIINWMMVYRLDTKLNFHNRYIFFEFILCCLCILCSLLVFVISWSVCNRIYLWLFIFELIYTFLYGWMWKVLNGYKDFMPPFNKIIDLGRLGNILFFQIYKINFILLLEILLVLFDLFNPVIF